MIANANDEMLALMSSGNIIAESYTMSSGRIITEGYIMSKGRIIAAGNIMSEGHIITEGNIMSDQCGKAAEIKEADRRQRRATPGTPHLPVRANIINTCWGGLSR